MGITNGVGGIAIFEKRYHQSWGVKNMIIIMEWKEDICFKSIIFSEFSKIYL